MKWLEIAVSVKRQDIDAVSAAFDGIETGGVVIEDPALIYDVAVKGNSETIALDIPADPDSPPVIKGYLPVDHRLSPKLAELYESLGAIDRDYPGQVILSEMEDCNWMEKWREFYQPVRVGRRLLVKPSWVPVDQAEGLLVIEMDPGMAFGCGTHPTTTMCMCMLEDLIKGGETVFDVGTGSGILAITAAKLGAAGVLAVDSDPTAIRVARDNVAASGLEGSIRVREGNLLDGIDTPAGVIVANIVADVIIKLVPQASLLLTRGGKFLASGIIAGRSDQVAGALDGSGLKIIKTSLEGEWVAFLAEKDGN